MNAASVKFQKAKKEILSAILMKPKLIIREFSGKNPKSTNNIITMTTMTTKTNKSLS